jgi:hypothetical protein
MLEPKVNALGEPSPNRTDFKNWERETLEQFAREAADENLVLRTDLRAALDAYRKLVIQMENTPCKASK